MSAGWELRVRRDDFARVEIVETDVSDPATGEALLRVDRVGVTANNVTYAVMGEGMNYWDFFPTEDGWGRVPLWGFAEVVASTVAGLETGARVYGYLPSSSHLVVRPDRVSASGFRDSSEHRLVLPPAYNRYAGTSDDPAYAPEDEDLQILYRPLFMTSFMLDDFLWDNDYFGARNVVVSSASSKTAYSTVFLHRARSKRPKLIGLTSPRNVDFTRSLGCFDEVLTYDEVDSLEVEPTLYEDYSGDTALRERMHAHLGKALIYDAVVGFTHHEAPNGTGAELAGANPTMFFAPAQMKKRHGEWGPGGIAKRHAEAWRSFVPTLKTWVEVRRADGPEGLREVWLEVLAGRIDPREGNVVAL